MGRRLPGLPDPSQRLRRPALQRGFIRDRLGRLLAQPKHGTLSTASTHHGSGKLLPQQSPVISISQGGLR